MIAAPAGEPASRENVSVWPASGSFAVAVKARDASSAMDLFPIAASTGGWLAPALTVIVIPSESPSGGTPSSVTVTVSGNVPVAAGVQLKMPVEALIVAPAGAPVRPNDFPFPGRSASVAVAVKVSGLFTVTVLSPIAAKTGAWFTSFTVIENPAELLAEGLPLSVAVTVTG